MKKNHIMSATDFLILESWDAMNEATELSDKQISYRKLMSYGLFKFDAKSPADLSVEKKKEFFNWVKDNWDKETGKVKDSKVQDEIDKALKDGKIQDPVEAAKKGANTEIDDMEV